MYEHFYGFAERPFRITPDPACIFPSREHTRALSYLQYGLEQREGFVVISGDIGSGKTLLIQRLLAELPMNRIQSAQVAAANVDGNDVLPFVVNAFGLEHSGLDKVALLRTFARFLDNCYARGTGALLIVDEAQGLTRDAIEELRILSNMQVQGRPVLQIFLIGQPELRDTICGPGMEQMRQRILAMYHLKPLSLDETKAYVEFRLRSVGWDGDPQFDEEIHASAYRWANGIPRRINLLYDRLLLLGYLEELHTITESVLETTITELAAEEPTALPNRQSQTNLDATKRLDRLERMVLALFRRLERFGAGA